VNGFTSSVFDPIRVAAFLVKSRVSTLHRLSASIEILLALESSWLELYAFMKADSCSPDGAHESVKKVL
jgi:hypothetical protein